MLHRSSLSSADHEQRYEWTIRDLKQSPAALRLTSEMLLLPSQAWPCAIGPTMVHQQLRSSVTSTRHKVIRSLDA